MLAIQNCFNKSPTSSLLSAAALGVVITSLAILALSASISPTSTIASALFTGTSLGLTVVTIASLVRHVKQEKVTSKQIVKFSSMQMQEMKVSFVNAHLEHFKPEQIGWLTDKQLPELDIAHLSDEQLNALLPTGGPFEKIDTRRRLHLLRVDQVSTLEPKLSVAQRVLAPLEAIPFIDVTLLTPELIGWLANERIASLAIPDLTKEQLNALFPIGQDAGLSKQRLKCLVKDQIKALAPRLSDEQLALFDDELLKQMDLNLFSALQIKVLFTDTSRFARVITEGVQGELQLKLAMAGYQKNS